ncbi:hypothetical protein DOY81_002203 [Sarcophaga bullata]|nr:hypothetical protein DOY81_002203 [Sarcophaga bullata]
MSLILLDQRGSKTSKQEQTATATATATMTAIGSIRRNCNVFYSF